MAFYRGLTGRDHAVFEFLGESRLDAYSAAILNGNYRLVGTDTILLQSNGREEKLELEWDSQDRARIDDEAAGKSIDLARVGRVLDSKSPLTGEWSTAREWKHRPKPSGPRLIFFGRESCMDDYFAV